jgi:hypothetical protein
LPGTLAVAALEHDRQRLTAQLTAPGFSRELDVTVAGGTFSESPDFLVPTMLFPAMRMGATPRIDAPVSEKLLAGAAAVQDVVLLWEDAFTRVEMDAPVRRDDAPPTGGAGAFFSGGVDSFYTVVKHLDDITHLVFVENVFDPRVPTGQAREAVHAAAAEFGKPLLEVRANFRHVGDAAGVRHLLYHGPALAAIGLLLQGTFRRVLIGSTFSYDNLGKWGSHPLIDPHWSTEQMEVVHDGCEATRPMKVARLADSEVAMRHLRVCQNRPLPGLVPSGRLNCGACKKCLITMTNLAVAGALDRCETFPDELDLELLAQLSIDDERDFLRFSENLRAAETRNPELAGTLRECLERNQVQDPIAAITEKRAAEKTIAKQAREIDALQRSVSWRITAPLRAVAPRRRG